METETLNIHTSIPMETGQQNPFVVKDQQHVILAFEENTSLAKLTTPLSIASEMDKPRGTSLLPPFQNADYTRKT